MTVLLFVVGAAFLIAGAELLVRGASRLAAVAGIPPLVVGLTVVAFGTSSPELAVTIGAAHAGQGDVALGNVVGSNIFNVLFILGLSAAIAPLVVSRQLVRLDVPLMIAASLATLWVAMDGRVSATEGTLLFAALVVYTGLLLLQSMRSAGGDGAGVGASEGAGAGRGKARGGSGGRSWIADLAFVVGGLILLVLGADWLVEGAVATATALGVSELVVGLTIVAAGTSLPEVATSVLAGIRGQRDIAVGNVVGSNIFNILAVLGLGSILAPDGLAVSSGAIVFDIPVMIAVAVAALPIFFTGGAIARWEGFVFLGFYVLYTAFLIMDAAAHPALDELRDAMLWFVLPLTALTLGVLAARAVGSRRG